MKLKNTSIRDNTGDVPRSTQDRSISPFENESDSEKAGPPVGTEDLPPLLPPLVGATSFPHPCTTLPSSAHHDGGTISMGREKGRGQLLPTQLPK